MNPPLKWHGGKTYLAEWIRSLAPEGRYLHRVHPYGGGLGEFWSWQHEGISEVVNDLDDRLTNLWQVLQERRTFDEFTRKVAAAPFSRYEFENARIPRRVLLPGDVDSAVDFFLLVRQSRQGLMKDFATLSRNRTRRGMNEQVSAWLTAVEGLPEVHARLKRVVIENVDAITLIKREDGPQTFFYCDPPYIHESRSAKKAYSFEMERRDHVTLLETLGRIKGMFALSGYHDPVYSTYAKYFGWILHEREIDNKASSAKVKQTKTECLWCNYH